MALLIIHVVFFNCAWDEACQTYKEKQSPDCRNKCSKAIKQAELIQRGFKIPGVALWVVASELFVILTLIDLVGSLDTSEQPKHLYKKNKKIKK